MNKNKYLLILLVVVFISLVTSVGIFVRAYSQKNGVKKPSENQTNEVSNQKETKLNSLKTSEKQVSLSIKYNLAQKSVSLILNSTSPVLDGEVVLTYPKLIKFVKNDSKDFFYSTKIIESTNNNNNMLRIGFLGTANRDSSLVLKVPNSQVIATLYFSSLAQNSISVIEQDTQFFDEKGDQMILSVL